MALAAGEVVTSGNGICFVRGGRKLLCSGGESRMIGVREKIPAWHRIPMGAAIHASLKVQISPLSLRLV